MGGVKKFIVSSDMHDAIMSMLDSERGKDRLQRVADRHIRHRSLHNRSVYFDTE